MKNVITFLLLGAGTIATAQTVGPTSSATSGSGTRQPETAFSSTVDQSTAISYIVCSKMRPSQRIQLIDSLGNDLGAKDITSLYEFLKRPTGLQGEDPGVLHFIKNEVFTALRHQSTPPVGLTEVFISISQDARQDTATRDYAVQHLVSWYRGGLLDSPSARVRIRAALEKLAESHDCVAGTALLGLHHLAPLEPAIHTKDLQRIALAMVRSKDSNSASMTTAIQVCAEEHIKEAVPAMEIWARKQGQTTLQRAAISALGMLGGSKEVALLRDLGRSDPLLKAVADQALRRLEHPVASRQSF
jgi:hypothetical protein